MDMRKTTIKIIDEELWKWVKIQAIKHDKGVSEFIFQLLEEAKRKEERAGS